MPGRSSSDPGKVEETETWHSFFYTSNFLFAFQMKHDETKNNNLNRTIAAGTNTRGILGQVITSLVRYEL